MSHAEKIKEKLIEGMRQACVDTLYFTDDASEKVAAEYLLTVNVAKKIATLNYSFGNPYKIYLERKTKKFAGDCIPLFKKVPDKSNFIKYRSIVRKKHHNTERNGKIDISVYDNKPQIESPICAIELKGFNPSRTNIIKDLKRNSEYFFLTDDTGDSLIQFTVFGALHSFNRINNTNSLEALLKKYKNCCSEVSAINQLLVETKHFEISRQSSEHDERHYFVGILVYFQKIYPSRVAV